jgi:hypothetical protein
MEHINDVFDLIEEVDALARHQIEQMERMRPEDLGLDNRAAWRLWVDSTCIAVKLDNDRTMQYYGGFEYVPEDNRKVIGEFVFYLIEGDEGNCSRIEGCIESAREALEKEGKSLR